MRKYFKPVSLIVLLFSLIALFVNCQFDDKESYLTIKKNPSSFKVAKLNKKQYSSNSKLIGKLSTIESKISNNILARNVSANDNSFSIDTDFTFFIEKENGKHSYTFLINRPNSVFQLENLILNSNDSLGYDIYLAQYDITALEYEQILNGQNPNVSNKITLVKLDNESVSIANLINGSLQRQGECLTETFVQGNTCPGRDQHTLDDILGGAICPYFIEGAVIYRDHTIYTWGPCGYDDSGGSSGDPSGGSTGGSPGGGGDGSDGSTTDNPTGQDKDDSVITTPVVPSEPESEPETPCEYITQKVSRKSFKEKFKELNKTEKLNLSHESGFVEKIVDGSSQFFDLRPRGQNHLLLIAGSLNATHVHQNIPRSSNDGTNYDSRVKIQSIGDLDGLIRVLQNNNSNPLEAFNIMISDEGIYAITILQPILYDEVLSNKLEELNIEYEKLSKKIITNYNIPINRKKALQKMFLNLIQKIGLQDSIGLFEANIVDSENIDNYKINWTRKKLLNNEIIDELCN